MPGPIPLPMRASPSPAPTAHGKFELKFPSRGISNSNLPGSRRAPYGARRGPSLLHYGRNPLRGFLPPLRREGPLLTPYGALLVSSRQRDSPRIPPCLVD